MENRPSVLVFVYPAICFPCPVYAFMITEGKGLPVSSLTTPFTVSVSPAQTRQGNRHKVMVMMILVKCVILNC